MSKVCDICAKGALKGNLVKRGIGRRVTRRTIMKQEVNLFDKKIKIDNTTIKVKICSSCLKRLKFEQAALNAEKVQKTAEVSA
ncbi:50S ribosomal protein L28 [Patescibacteria group bacterium]|nr:50S ribosomal protein L28 [Patescibacteria group bacterium]